MKCFFLTSIFGLTGVVLFTGTPVFSYEASRDAQLSHMRYKVVEADYTCNKNSQCMSNPLMFSEEVNAGVVEQYVAGIVSLRTLEGSTWSPWKRVEGEIDTPDQHTEDIEPYFFVGQSIRAVQFRTEGGAKKLGVIPMNMASTKKGYSIASSEGEATLGIVMRPQWLDSQVELPLVERQRLWPQEYDNAKKIIVHHTASNISDTNQDGLIDQKDYALLVRAIYTYHAKSRKWGDIGYNYLIDPSGTIWEGREGGDGVTAGHAYRDAACKKFETGALGFNRGTIGIALLGNYSDQPLSHQAKESLTALIARKAWEFDIEPAGSSFFHDKEYPNVIGHRDVDCTECPGTQLYSGLGEIISTSQQQYLRYKESGPKTIQTEILEITPKEIELSEGEVKEVTVKVKNTGSATWRNYGDKAMYLASGDIKNRLASLGSFSIAAEEKDVAMDDDARNILSYIEAKPSSPNIAPGETTSFTLVVKNPPKDLISKKRVVLALGNKGWLPGTDMAITVVNTGLPLAATLERDMPATKIPDEEKTSVSILFKNRGTQNWNTSDLALDITDNNGKALSLLGHKSKKLIPTKAAKTNPKTIEPGKTALFNVVLQGAVPGDFPSKLSLQLKKEPIIGSDYEPITWSVQPSYAAEILEQTIPEKLTAGMQGAIMLKVKNVGTKPWSRAPLTMTANKRTTSAFATKSWKAKNTPERISTLKPGEMTTILFPLQAPKRAGSYTEELVFKQDKREMYVVIDGKSKKKISLAIEIEPAPKMVKVPAKALAKSKKTR